MIQPEIKRKIEKVVNVFETGTPEGRYDLLVVMNDGPGGRPQITYGRSQTTEFGIWQAC
jgi:chitosanase